MVNFGFLVLHPNDEIKLLSGHSKGRHPLVGAEIIDETGADPSKRFTFIKFIAVGLFSLAIKKKSSGEKWLLVHGDGFDHIEEVPFKQQVKAPDFLSSGATVDTSCRVIARRDSSWGSPQHQRK